MSEVQWTPSKVLDDPAGAIEEMDDLKVDLAKANREINDLHSRVLRYGSHKDKCSCEYGGKCSCGWDRDRGKSVSWQVREGRKMWASIGRGPQ